jgi:hypothetical protein
MSARTRFTSTPVMLVDGSLALDRHRLLSPLHAPNTEALKGADRIPRGQRLFRPVQTHERLAE